MNIKQILSKILEKSRPSKDYISFLKKESSRLLTILKKNKLNAKIGGSLAKGTLVNSLEKPDVDVFVVFNDENEMGRLGNVLSKINGFGFLREVHGSRDYFQLEGENIIFEIIPVLRNKKGSEIKNVTDFSLKHVDYVKKKIRKNPKIADEIILAKTFFKANKLYGAESYVRGFSGYSLEVLIIYFGGFIKFIKEIRKSRIIDPENYFKNDNEIKRELNESKIKGPIILVDPTYKYRNVCAGLGQETFDKALKLMNKFLKNPTFDFFKRKEFDLDRFKKLSIKKKATLLELNLSTDRQEGDIAGTKMKKVFDFLVRELERKQQKVISKEFIYGNYGKNAKGYLMIIEKKVIEIKGPKKKMVKALENFKKVRGSVFFKGNFCYAREKVRLDDLFKKILKSSKDMGAKVDVNFI
jgi:tRNA nucleotidyltransferase (CCA-adding enzyme)